jgi:hypothetical protein
VPTWSVLQMQLHGHVVGLIGSMLIDWFVGSICVGALLAMIAFVSLRLVLHVAFGRRGVAVDDWPVAAAANAVGSAE